MKTVVKIQKSKVYVDANGVMRGFKKPDKIYLERFDDKEEKFARGFLNFTFFSFLIALATFYLIIKGN